MLLLDSSVPELPLAKAQLTGRFAVNVTVPFSPAKVADGLITKPPLVIAAAPVPASPTDKGEPGSFPAIEIDAASAATNDGLKLTEIVQVAPEATIVPQVFDDRKSPELDPVTAILVIAR